MQRHPFTFERIQNYNGIKHVLESVLENKIPKDKLARCLSCPDDYILNNEIHFPSKEKCRVLIVGCGSSSLGHDMLLDGWEGGVTNVDYSSVVISQMKDKYQMILEGKKQKMSVDSDSLEEFQFICADITEKLNYPDSSFDLIIDKGLLETLLCSSVRDCRLAMNECSRLLKEDHGEMVIFSRKKPDDCLHFIENPGWTGGIWYYRIPQTATADEQEGYNFNW